MSPLPGSAPHVSERLEGIITPGMTSRARVTTNRDAYATAGMMPTKFRMVVNLRTAKAVGLTLPPSIFAGADEVID
jgi:hypothetical protein